MKTLLKITLLSIAIVLSSCATILAPKQHTLSITSEPPQAEVYINGFKSGTTPVELNLKADKSYIVEYRLEGYQTVTRVVNVKIMAGYVVLDILWGFLPVVVDAATGAWNKFDTDAINAVLERK